MDLTTPRAARRAAGPSRRDIALLAGAALWAAPAAARAAAPAADEAAMRALYARFLAAQNDRDLDRVRATLWDSPDFLWVSDGRPFWGPDALVARMAMFQKAEVWRVEPHPERSRAVSLSADAGYLSLPLTLAIGPAAGPARLPWLVGVLCRRESAGWRIAALFTTEDKSV